MQHHAVHDATPLREAAVFVYDQAGRVDIAAAHPVVEIIPVSVVPRMLAAPHAVGGQREQAAEHADHVVRASGPKEGAVPAVVLDDEDPHDEGRCWHGQC